MTRQTMRRTLAGADLFLAGLVVGSVLALWPDASAAPVVHLPACQAEDSTDCVWDAQARGNGRGSSFVNIDGTIYSKRSE